MNRRAHKAITHVNPQQKKKKKGKNLSPQQSKTKRRKQKLKNQRKKKKKKKEERKVRDPRRDGECETESARRRGSAATPWRREARDGETRETESETTRPTPRRRLRERDPRRFPICPAHRYLSFPDLCLWIFSFNSLTDLVLVLCGWTAEVWTDSELFVFFFLFWVFGFVSLWDCDCVALAALHNCII